jgi:hypothetical protein
MRAILLLVVVAIAGCGTSSSANGSADAGDDSAGASGDAAPPPPALTWAPVSLPLSNTAKQGAAIPLWGSGPNDVYVSTSDGLLHLGADGSWTNVLSGTIEGVWGSGPGDVYAVTALAIMHSAGDGKWTTSFSNTGSALCGIWGTGPTDIWVAGVADTGSPAMLHFDGSHWQRTPLTANVGPASVWSSGPSDVYAAGPWPCLVTSLPGDLLHFDGTGWKAQSIGESQGIGGLGPVWGSSAQDVYLGAIATGPAPTDILFHSAGDGTWSPVIRSTQVPSSRQTGVGGIWGSAGNDVYATTFVWDTSGGPYAGGTLLHSAGDGTWTPVDAANKLLQVPLFVWGSGATDVYVGGRSITNGALLIHGTAP